MSQILASKISTVRRKHAVIATSTGLSAAVGAFALVLSLSMLLDWWFNLSVTARAALLAVNVAAVVWVLLYAIFGPLLYGPDDDEIALMVEDAEPAFRTRLIASVQLSRKNAVPAGASQSLASAMIAQAESLAGPMDFARVIKTDALTRVALTAVSILVLAGGVFAWAGESAQTLLRRAFLSNAPVPRKTTVLPITDNLLAARGDSVEILAIADRAQPASEETRRVNIKTSGEGRKQYFTMERVTLSDPAAPPTPGQDPPRLAQVKAALRASSRAAQDPRLIEAALRKLEALGVDTPVYAAVIENVQESFTYTVRLNDADSPQAYTVDVRPRPAVTRVEARQVYPAYTKRPVELRGLGDLSVLEGSKLRLSVAANKPLSGKPAPGSAAANFVHLIGSDRDMPLAVDAQDPKLLSGEIDLPAGTTGFSINLTDQDGLRSKDPAVYRVDLIPDKAPAARIVQPNRKEVLLVRNGRLQVVFEATDDYSIGKALIKYRLDEGKENTVPLDMQGQTPKTFRGQYLWKLSDIQPETAAKPNLEGSVIEYWVEVHDTNDVAKAGPGKGVSEHYMIRIGTEEEVRIALAQRMADIGSSLRTNTDEQEGLTNKVQTIVLERQTAPAPKP